jgi:hypothetical protein
MRRGPVFGLAMILIASPRLASGQTRVSLGAGVASVRTADGTEFGSLALSPSFQLQTPGVSVGLGATAAALADGATALQGATQLWIVSSPAGRIRAALEVGGAGSTRSDAAWTAAAAAVAEVLWAASRWGFALGAGPSAGWIADALEVTAFHGRARGWWRPGRVTATLSIDPVHLLDTWYGDVGAGITLDAGPVVASVGGAARFRAASGPRAAGSAFFQVFPTPHVALEAGAGTYLPEPLQGFPRGSYVVAGVRLFAAARAPRAVVASVPPPRPPDSVIVRFRLPDADSVAIAGEWDGWRPLPLRRTAPGEWEGMLRLRPGRYRFLLRVNGVEWVVPEGVPVERDRDGGMVAVLRVRD